MASASGKKRKTQVHHTTLPRMIATCAAILLALNAAYLLFMTVVFLLPLDARVKGNVRESLHVWNEGLETEGPVFGDNRIVWNDTRAEMQMADIVVTSAGSPLTRGVAQYWLFLPDEGDPDPVRQYKSLERAVNDPEDARLTTESYGRYWFLITGALRMLYSFLTIGEIRWLLFAAGGMLMLWLVCRVFSLQGVRGVIPLALAVLSRNLLLQTAYSPTAMDICVMLVSMILVTYLYRTPWFSKNRLYYYLALGSVTFAIGPFIAPLLTLGMTLILEIRLSGKEDTAAASWKDVVSAGFLWVAGYAATMLIKALLSMAAVQNADGAEIAAGYMGAGHTLGLTGRIGRVMSCIGRLLMPLQPTILVALIFAAVFIIVVRKKGLRRNKSAALTLAVSLTPVFWAFIVAEHTVHDYAVNMFAITTYGVVSLFADYAGGDARKS